jgi:bifunctional DNase/RNase
VHSKHNQSPLRRKDLKITSTINPDLFKNFADRFDIVVKQVIIHKLVDGVFLQQHYLNEIN